MAMVKKIPFTLGLRFRGFDLLLVLPSKLVLYHIVPQKTGSRIKAKYEAPAEIFRQGIFSTQNFRQALQKLKSEHPDLVEAGIILHLPGLIYQKFTLPFSKNIQTTLLNYLRVNFPLPLQNYYLFTKLEKENRLQNELTVSVFFLPKQLIDSLVNVLESSNIVPIFAVHSFNALDIFAADYFSIESDIDFLFLIQIDRTIVTSWLKNYQHQKVLVDEIDLEEEAKIEKILAYYDQIIPSATREIFLLAEMPIKEELKTRYQIKELSLTKDDFWALVGNLVYRRVAKKELIDLLPERPIKIFFFNRLVPILRLASLFSLALIIFSGILWFATSRYLQSKIGAIEIGVKETIDLSTKEAEVNAFTNLLEAYLRRYRQPLPINFLAELSKVAEIDKISADLQGIKIWVIIEKERLAEIESLAKDFQIKNIQEEEETILLLLEK